MVIVGSGDLGKYFKDKVDLLTLDSIEFWSVPAVKGTQIKVQVDIILLPIKKWAATISIL